MKVLLVSHGYLAKEMFATAQMIFGAIDNMSYLELPYGCDLEDYKKQIIDKIDEASSEGGLLILADLFGGSPFMLSTQIFSNPEYLAKAELVTGMNLGMVLEVAARMSGCNDLNELKEVAVTAGSEGICDLKQRMG